jgi:(R,R)-butanediol dehydrogenase/meso-butanediol dehydrogenase/diacetyl reductase
VVLLGVGAIGSFIAAGLRAHDGPVVAVDVNPARLAVAAALGVPTVRLVAPDAGAAELRDMLPDEPDVVFETSGVTGAAERAFAVTARGGTTVLVGLNQTPQPLNLASLVLREVDVRTTVAHVCDEDLAAALDLLTANPLAELMVDRIVPLADVVATGFEPLAAGTVSGKVLVDPRHG